MIHAYRLFINYEDTGFMTTVFSEPHRRDEVADLIAEALTESAPGAEIRVQSLGTVHNRRIMTDAAIADIAQWGLR